MVQLRKRKDLESIANDLDRDITERYALEDATSSKKRLQYGLGLLAFVLVFVGGFLWIFKQHSAKIQEQYGPKAEWTLSDMMLADGEQSHEWTYKEFMAIPLEETDLTTFLDTYGKADDASQSTASNRMTIILNYTFNNIDEDRFEFVDFQFEESADGSYRLSSKFANGLLKQNYKKSHKKIISQSWTEESFDNLIVTDKDEQTQGETIDVILETYGEPVGDTLMVLPSGTILIALNYQSYKEGEMLYLSFENAADESWRLTSKSSAPI